MEREITATERAVWKQGMISLNIVMIARITGNISAHDLRKAWKILQQKHPMLAVHLQKRQQGIFFTSNNCEDIPVRELAATSDNFWQYVAMQELHTPFDDFTNKPFIRSVLIHSDNKVELLIVCHHCICDGLSATFLIRDILNCLSGQQNLVAQSSEKLVMDKLLPPTAQPNKAMMLAVSLGNLLFAKLKRIEHIPKISMEENSIATWDIDQHQTAVLLAACKKHQVTVHAALLAILQAAQYNIQGDGKKYFARNYTPVNLRNRLTASVRENFGLYAAEAYISCKYNPRENIWQNAQRFQQSIKDSVGDDKVIAPLNIINSIDANLLDRLLVYLYKKQSVQYGYGLSNLGNINLNTKYADLILEAIHASVYVKRAEKTLALLTLNKQIYFTLTYRPAQISTKTVVCLRENVLQLLAESILE